MAEKSISTAEKRPAVQPAQQEQIQPGSAVQSLLTLQKAAGNRAVGRFLEGLPGQELDADTRRWMEARFKANFGQVQVHTGEHAGELAQSLRASAVTTGTHIAFSPGLYNPRSPDGRRLLAHELAHVVQQSSGQSDPTSPPADESYEQAADHAADQALHGLGSPSGNTGTLARRAGSAPAAIQTKPANAARGPNKPVITPEIEAEMNDDIQFIVKKLANFDTDFKDRQEIIAKIEKYAQADQEYARSSGYKGSEFLDKFLLKTKLRVFSRKSFRSMWQEEHLLLYDALWYDLYGIWLDKFKQLVAQSQRQATSGPLSGAPENPWKTLSKQEAIGVWGTLKGMGTAAAAGLVDAPAKGIVKSMKLAGLDVADPIDAAGWLEKQYDISGEAMFGKEYSQGDALILGMNAAQIGTAGGKLIWTLVMLGAGKGASTSVKGTLATLGVLGNFDGIISSATNIANLVETLQKQDKLTLGTLLTNRQFLEEVTKLAANIFGAISAGLGTNKSVSEATRATFARVGILLDLAQVSVMVGKLVEIATSDMSVQNKESAAGQVVAELITSAVSIAVGAAEYKKEHGKSGSSEEQGKPPPKLLEEHKGAEKPKPGEAKEGQTPLEAHGSPGQEPARPGETPQEILGPTGEPMQKSQTSKQQEILGPDGKPLRGEQPGKPVEILGPDGKPLRGEQPGKYVEILGPDGKVIEESFGSVRAALESQPELVSPEPVVGQKLGARIEEGPLQQPSAPRKLSREEMRAMWKTRDQTRNKALAGVNDPALRAVISSSKFKFKGGDKLIDLLSHSPSQIQGYWERWVTGKAKGEIKSKTFEEYVSRRMSQERGGYGEKALAFELGPSEEMVKAPKENANAPGTDAITYDPSTDKIKLRDNKAFSSGSAVESVSALERNLLGNLEDDIAQMQSDVQGGNVPPEFANKVLPRLLNAAKDIKGYISQNISTVPSIRRRQLDSLKHQRAIDNILTQNGIERIVTSKGGAGDVEISTRLGQKGFEKE